MESTNKYILTIYKEELLQPFPSRMDILFLPFNEVNSLEDCFENIQKALARSIKMKNRILALTNAFFLGLLLNEVTVIKGKPKPRKKLTAYYTIMARYVYDIFEPNPSHLLYTMTTKV